MSHPVTAPLGTVKASGAFSFLLTIASLAVALSLGCATTPTATPTAEIPVDPQEVLNDAVIRLMTIQSAAFTLEHRAGTSVLLPGLEMDRVYGVAVIPDSFRFTVEARYGGSYIETDMVVIARQAYMTNFFTGQWQEVSLDVMPLNFADLGKTLSDILLAVEAPSLIGTQTLKGHQAYMIQGRVHSEDLSALVPMASVGYDVELELAVDQVEALLLQVVISGRVVATDTQETVRVLSLDDFDVPADIKVPR